nr:MAG TPA: hypothetical protein [Caudoviricetes sp.]
MVFRRLILKTFTKLAGITILSDIKKEFRRECACKILTKELL